MAFVRYAKKQKRDADGKKLCKVCDGPLPERRSSYCSDDCWYRNSPNIMRRQVWKRDQGVCVLCGTDTKTLPVPERWAYRYGANHKWEMDHVVPVSEGGGLCGLEGYRTLCRPCHGKESGALRKRLNESKRVEKIQRETGRLFA